MNASPLNPELEPVVGFEPTTDGLQNRCSTTELNWHPSAKGYTTKEIARKRISLRLRAFVFERRYQASPIFPIVLLTFPSLVLPEFAPCSGAPGASAGSSRRMISNQDRSGP